MLSIDFWKGALERAVKTFFQVFVAVVTASLGAEALGVSAGLLDASWLDALSVAALATILSVATSLGNADFTAGKNVLPNVGEVTLVHDVRLDDNDEVQVTTRTDDTEANTGNSTGPHFHFQTEPGNGKHVAED